jgi:NitT/TauT family transport system permease protein
VFLIFFNAYEGGLTVPEEMLQGAKLMGANPFERMVKIRWPFVLTWSLAQIPNAVSFGIVATVTTELFTGSNGIGGILITAIDTANADLTFAVVILLGVVSVVLIFAAERVKRFLLRWQ